MRKKTIFSIITVCYNDLKGLKKTVKSVQEQEYSNYEYIIIDGMSTDGTIEYLEKLNPSIFWLYEKDDGLYDAMNKGIRKAEGDYLIFLNAGDVFYNSSTLNVIADKIGKKAVYFGRAVIYYGSEEYIYPNYKTTKNNINKWLELHVPNHQAMLFPKSFCKKNMYDTRLNVGADHDYKIRAMNTLDFRFIDCNLIKFEIGGLSTSYGSIGALRDIIKDSWKNNSKHYGTLYALKRVLINIVKYILIALIGLKNTNKIIIYRKN